MLQKVTFIKKSLYGAKGEERDVTNAAALQFARLGLIASLVDVKTKEEVPEVSEEINTQTLDETVNVPEQKEEKTKVETKEEKEVIETKEEKQDSRNVMGTKKVPKKEIKKETKKAEKPKITTAPKF